MDLTIDPESYIVCYDSVWQAINLRVITGLYGLVIILGSLIIIIGDC